MYYVNKSDHVYKYIYIYASLLATQQIREAENLTQQKSY